MVVLAVLDFEHHFDERVERILLQPLEVGRHVIRQAVDALVVGRAFFQKIFLVAITNIVKLSFSASLSTCSPSDFEVIN